MTRLHHPLEAPLRGVASRFLFPLMVILASGIPSLILSFGKYYEPWPLVRVARVVASLNDQQLAQFTTSVTAYTAERLGADLLIFIVSRLFGAHIAPEDIPLVPFGGIALPAMYYAAGWRFSRSKVIACALAIYAGWFYPPLVTTYATGTYTWTHVLFLGFLILWHEWIARRTPWESLLLVVLYVATFLTYHTTPVWMIAVLAITPLFDIGNSSGRPAKIGMSRWPLLLFAIALFLGFDTIFYGNFLRSFAYGEPEEKLLDSFLTRILLPLFPRLQPQLSPLQVVPRNPGAAIISTFLVLVMLVIPVVLWAVATTYRLLRRRPGGRTLAPRDIAVILAILAAFASHTAIYMLYGAMSPRVVQVLFPLMLPLVLWYLTGSRRLTELYLTALAALAVIGFLSYAMSLPTDNRSMATSPTLSAFFRSHDSILADGNAYGLVLTETARNGTIPNLVWINSEHYLGLLEPGETALAGIDYVLADKSGLPMISTDWVYFEPWTAHLPEIEENPELNIIYESYAFEVLQPATSPLREVTPSGSAQSRPAGTIILIALHVMIASAMVLPGIAPGLMFDGRSESNKTDPIDFLALSLPNGIAITILGAYLANLTSSLSLVLPMMAGITVTVMLATAAVNRAQKQYLGRIAKEALGVGVLLVVWASASTIVANMRGSIAGDRGVEFYLSCESSAQGTVLLNVRNSTSAVVEPTLSIRSSGGDEVIVRVRVQPQSVWTFPWVSPDVPPEGPIRFLLQEGDTLSFNLKLTSRALAAGCTL